MKTTLILLALAPTVVQVVPGATGATGAKGKTGDTVIVVPQR